MNRLIILFKHQFCWKLFTWRTKKMYNTKVEEKPWPRKDHVCMFFCQKNKNVIVKVSSWIWYWKWLTNCWVALSEVFVMQTKSVYEPGNIGSITQTQQQSCWQMNTKSKWIVYLIQTIKGYWNLPSGFSFSFISNGFLFYNYLQCFLDFHRTFAQR